MRLDRYLNQTVSYRPFSNTTDAWGQRGFATAQSIRARKELKQRVIRDRSGAENISEATVITTQEVQLGELLDGSEVQARENYVDRRGNVIGWRYFL
jgi:hypothetical protein